MLSSSIYLHPRERVTYGLHALTVSGGVVMLYVHAPSQVMRVMPFDSLSFQLYEVHDASDAASPPPPLPILVMQLTDAVAAVCGHTTSKKMEIHTVTLWGGTCQIRDSLAIHHFYSKTVSRCTNIE
jgi:hypothetical protein